MKEMKIENVSRQAEEALQKLCEFFRQQKRLMIAYSGGMDSSFMALVASRVIPDSYRCLLVSSPFMSTEEMRIARNTAARYSFRIVEIVADPLQSAEVICNDPLRCYHCKKLIFSELLKAAQPGEIICEGSVTDDDDDYRPGKQAIKELAVASPLQTCGFSKAMIAEVLQAMHAGEIVRAGQSCLATRIATGSPITTEKLRQIAEGEAILREAGLGFCRLRHHGDLARIETR
ncbi:MAG TPA: hypothetical protein PKC25_14130, partial [Candidatus Rifleibacterium sp.]|nr:hypothetical protein [Candidatus Rifleibacterium sp.]